MNDKTEKAMDKTDRPRAAPSADRGLLPTLVHVTSELASKAADGSFGLMRDIHGEVFTRLSSSIDFVDQAQQGTLNVARRLVARVDHFSSAAIGGGETVAASVVKVSRESGDSVVELSAKTTEAMNGKRAA